MLFPWTFFPITTDVLLVKHWMEPTGPTPTKKSCVLAHCLLVLKLTLDGSDTDDVTVSLWRSAASRVSDKVDCCWSRWTDRHDDWCASLHQQTCSPLCQHSHRDANFLRDKCVICYTRFNFVFICSACNYNDNNKLYVCVCVCVCVCACVAGELALWTVKWLEPQCHSFCQSALQLVPLSPLF